MSNTFQQNGPNQKHITKTLSRTPSLHYIRHDYAPLLTNFL